MLYIMNIWFLSTSLVKQQSDFVSFPLPLLRERRKKNTKKKKEKTVYTT